MANNKLTSRKFFEIYMVTCHITGKMYIGLTSIGAVTRWVKGHVAAAVSGKSDTVLARAIRKYGEEAFTICVIDTAKTFDSAKKKEIRYIAKLDTLAPNGLNTTPGGEGLTTCIPEVVQRIRESVVALWKDDEYRKKHRAAMKDVVRSKEYKENRKKAAQAIWKDPIYRSKQAAAFKSSSEQRKEAAIKMWAVPGYVEKQKKINSGAKKKEVGRIAALKRWHPEEWEKQYGGH